MASEDGPRMRAVLADAAMAFAGVPGVEVIDDGDLVRSSAAGRPVTYLNAVARLDLDADELAERVAAVEAPYRRSGLPSGWWVDDTSRPSDIADRLVALGLRQAGGEAVMVLELAGRTDLAAVAQEAAERARARVTPVAGAADLEAWIEVMAGSYGWSDEGRAAIMRELYDPAAAHGRDGRRVCLLARVEGRAAGAASLFVAAGEGWVTNVGTLPAARGRGVGAAVTADTVARAAARGDRAAWLAASEMGEPVYRRLGFRTVGRLDHLVGGLPGH